MRVTRNSAFTLVEIMIVVTIIGLLATLAIPLFSKARTTSITQKCIQNQRTIFHAAQRYEMDTGQTLASIKNNGVTIRNTLITNGYVRHQSAFECPASGTKDYDDYKLLYSSSDLTNTYCTIKPTVHVLP